MGDCPVPLGVYPVEVRPVMCEECAGWMEVGDTFVYYRGRVHPSSGEVLCVGCAATIDCQL